MHLVPFWLRQLLGSGSNQEGLNLGSQQGKRWILALSQQGDPVLFFSHSCMTFSIGLICSVVGHAGWNFARKKV